jgi:threonine dehydratase
VEEALVPVDDQAPAGPAARAVAPPGLGDVERAAALLAGQLPPTPLLDAPGLGAGALLKLETFQPTGSFKVRGALVALAAARPDGRRVVAASAGNHALGVAWAAARLGVAATVVVPATASPAKLAALGRFPVTLVRHGAGYDDAERHALGLAAEGGLRYVSPYNDTEVIAGQGTLGAELLGQVAGPLTVVCPAGGGGLLAGVALAATARASVRFVGVVTDAAPALRAALDAGRVVAVAERPTLADGLAGGIEPGSVTVELAHRFAHDVVVVPEAEVARAVRYLAGEHGLVAEGAGALGVAALLAGKVPVQGRAVAVVTGRNIALPLLARVLGDRDVPPAAS